jgi:hypothetical protein
LTSSPLTWARFLEGIGPKVDVIAYGMDGVLIRAYIAGLNTGPRRHRNRPLGEPGNSPAIRKLVLIGTPNFRVFCLFS